MKQILSYIKSELERIDALIAILFARVGGVVTPPPTPGVIQQIRIPLALANASSIALLPAGAFVTNCIVEIDAAYNTAATISVGQTGMPAAFMPTTGNKPSVVELYEQQQRTTVVAGLPVLVTITGATAGSGVAWVTYGVPLA
jgi:hypothetical protein